MKLLKYFGKAALLNLVILVLQDYSFAQSTNLDIILETKNSSSNDIRMKTQLASNVNWFKDGSNDHIITTDFVSSQSFDMPGVYPATDVVVNGDQEASQITNWFVSDPPEHTPGSILVDNWDQEADPISNWFISQIPVLPEDSNLVNNGDQEDTVLTNWFRATSSRMLFRPDQTVVHSGDKSTLLKVWDHVDRFFRTNSDPLSNDLTYKYSFWVNVDSLGTLGAGTNLWFHIRYGLSQFPERQINTGSDDNGTNFANDTWLYYEGYFEAVEDILHRLNFDIKDAGGEWNTAFFNVDDVNIHEVGEMSATIENDSTYIGQSTRLFFLHKSDDQIRREKEKIC